MFRLFDKEWEKVDFVLIVIWVTLFSCFFFGNHCNTDLQSKYEEFVGHDLKDCIDCSDW